MHKKLAIGRQKAAICWMTVFSAGGTVLSESIRVVLETAHLKPSSELCGRKERYKK